MAYVACGFKDTAENLVVAEERFRPKKIESYYIKGRIKEERKVGKREENEENKKRDD